MVRQRCYGYDVEEHIASSSIFYR